jgi:hypothetical protein
MQFLEKNLEQIIFESDRDILSNRGLNVYGTIKRQLRIGNYGIADLVTFLRIPALDGSGLRITVYELKQDKVGVNAMLQAYRYCCGIADYLRTKRGFSFKLSFKVVLIGNSIDNGDFSYLSHFLEDFDVITYSYKIDGIRFHIHNGFSLTNSGF